MAASCVRSVSRRIPLSSLGSIVARSRSSAAAAAAASPSSCFLRGAAGHRPIRRFSSLSRFPVELGCSLFPLHSAVAAARMTSRLSTTSRGDRALSQGILCRTYPGL